MSRFVIAFFFTIICAVAAGSRRTRVFFADEVERGDSFIDKLLEDMVQSRGDEYDPYYMEDSVIGFHRKIAFVNVSGEAKLHDGYITGLKTLHRPNHCSLSEKNGRLYVKADLGAGVLNFHYSGSVKFMNFGPTITLQGTLSYVEVFMEFNVDANTGLDGKLTKFKIDDMRGMKVWVTGLGPLNWAVNPIISAGAKIFKGFLKKLIENKVERHIAERLPNFQFPVDDIETTTTEETTSETTPEKTEEPQTEEPVTDETEEPVTDETEEPVTDETEEPVTDETEEPVTDETEEPVTDETEEPVTEETEEPVTEETEEPVTETEEPVIEETEEPVIEETEEPVIEETEEPVIEETEEPVIEETEEPVIDETEEPDDDIVGE